MKRIALLVLAATAIAVAQGQDKPRVFVNGKGTENVSTNASAGGNRWFRSGRADSTIGAHDEGMEVTKNLQKGCPGIIVTINQATADYIVILDRESKQNRGLLRTNSQIQVANRVGDVLGSSATRTVGNASPRLETIANGGRRSSIFGRRDGHSPPLSLPPLRWALARRSHRGPSLAIIATSDLWPGLDNLAF